MLRACSIKSPFNPLFAPLSAAFPLYIMVVQGGGQNETEKIFIFERHREQRYTAKPDSAEKFSDPARPIYGLCGRSYLKDNGRAYQTSENYIMTI